MKAGTGVAESLGLITARGGSKGLLRKNIRELAGKPLIAWTIEASLKSRSLSRVIVSTEDEEIAGVARKYGAEVPFMRPADLASDDASHISVVRHAVEWLARHDDWSPDYAVTLLPTCPLRAAEDIDGAIDLARSRAAEAVVGVTEARDHPFLTRRMSDGGVLEEFVPCDLEYPRRQDLPQAFAINGAVYVNQCRTLSEQTSLVPPGALGFVMPPERSLDIDTAWDFHLAELLMRARFGPATEPMMNSKVLPGGSAEMPTGP